KTCHPEPREPTAAESTTRRTYALVDVMMNRWVEMSEADPNQQAPEGTTSSPDRTAQKREPAAGGLCPTVKPPT
ncbi:MAG TPA: hypothetical protein VK930_15070, partial [Verrucomicrobiae bacterium]|nr:hypothetical protein [Verrucomicrobiae bacterium]